jgi:hypothetical protein
MGTATGEAPNINRLQITAPAVGTAGNDDNAILGRAPFTGTVTGVSYIPKSAITGANTNTRRVALVNKGQSGSGTTEIAAIQYNSGVNAVAFDENIVTLSGTAANLDVVEGDILAFTSTHVGTGITDPGGLVIVTLSRD